MIVSQFQSWAETASAPSRADGVSALARAVLYSDLDPGQRSDAISALTRFLDDPSPLVRRALASAFASAAEAPPRIVLALADDQPGIAAIVLSRSPILSDAELIDRIEGLDEAVQSAIAARPYLAAAVLDRLAEVGTVAALIVLSGNVDVILPDHAIKRMVSRLGADAAFREALLARKTLPLEVRAELVAATAGALAGLVMQRSWMSGERTQRITREATERATIAIAAAGAVAMGELRRLAAHLRSTGQLTVALVLRTLLSGNQRLFEAMLGELSGLGVDRVEGLIRDDQSAGFAALYRKAGLPQPLLPAFRLALSALRDHDLEAMSGTALSAPLVAQVLAGCVAANDGAFDKLLVLLRRFDMEAAREALRVGGKVSPVRSIEPAVASSRAAAASGVARAIDFDEAVPMPRALAIRAPEPARFTIDLAAIEAELMAA